MENNSKPVLGADEKFCESCGKVVKKRAILCPSCGVKVKGGGGKNKIVAALLALFLGGFGIHKFYLGQIGIGAVYLIFFWTVIPSIIAFIEFILFLTMSDDKFDEKYNN